MPLFITRDSLGTQAIELTSNKSENTYQSF